MGQGAITCLVIAYLLSNSATHSLPVAKAPEICEVAPYPYVVRQHLSVALDNAIGGGQVKDGPFTFCLVLYRDARLQPTSNQPGLISQIPGIGLAALWFYNGSDGGQIVQSFGLLPGPLQPIAQYNVIQKGASGNRFGGVLLPDHSRLGDKVEWGLKISTPGGVYGAKIKATLSEHGVQQISVVRDK